MGPTNPQSFQGQPQNPFMEMLSKLKSQGGQQAPGNNIGSNTMLNQLSGAGGQPSQPGGSPVAAQGAQQPDIQDAAIPGQNPGSSKQLIGAMNQLHAAITGMTDPHEIQMLRSIIVLLNQLIVADQQKQNTTTGASIPQQQSQGPMPTGQPTGAPNPAM